MLVRLAVLAASIALAGCANMESAGRNADRAPAPPAMADEAQPPMVQNVTPAPAPPAPAPQAPSVAAPAVTAPPVPAPREVAEGEADIVVPGQRETQVQPPDGDPRSNAERAEDVRAWDRCLMEVQSAFESDPMNPQLDTPEQHCRESLGMRSRTAVPESRRQR